MATANATILLPLFTAPPPPCIYLMALKTSIHAMALSIEPYPPSAATMMAPHQPQHPSTSVSLNALGCSIVSFSWTNTQHPAQTPNTTATPSQLTTMMTTTTMPNSYDCTN